MQVDDYSQYTDEELEELDNLCRKIEEHEREELVRKSRLRGDGLNSKRRKGRSLGGAKVRR